MESLKRIISFVLFMFVFSAAGYSSGFSAKGQDCAKCHTLKKDEAARLMKGFDQNIKIKDISVSAARYLFEVSVESNGKKGIVYIDFPKKHLFSGSLFQINGKRNLTQESLSAINKVNVSEIPLGDALLLGAKKARHRVIVFTDPDCPFCGKLHEELKKIVKERKDISFAIKMFPLKMHVGAYDKSKAIVCEKSLALLDKAFAKKSLPSPKCKTTAVDDTIKLAAKLGITGTPALIMPDGRVISGFRDANALKELILRK